jgi:hypothetical protein
MQQRDDRHHVYRFGAQQQLQLADSILGSPVLSISIQVLLACALLLAAVQCEGGGLTNIKRKAQLCVCPRAAYPCFVEPDKLALITRTPPLRVTRQSDAPIPPTPALLPLFRSAPL